MHVHGCIWVPAGEKINKSKAVGSEEMPASTSWCSVVFGYHVVTGHAQENDWSGLGHMVVMPVHDMTKSSKFYKISRGFRD
jgi:hypothetical protein